MAWGSIFLQVILLLSLGVASSGATSDSQCQITPTDKRRLFVLTDIANEPDDAQSLVRLLVYSNEFDIQGIVATTSVWLNDTTRADQIYGILDAYEEVLPNLRKHADGYPEAAYLRGLVTSGLPVYGMDGVGSAKDSDGSKLLVSAVDASDEPTWVLVWGGSSVLAQALWHVNATRSSTEVEKFVSKLRAYAISDQDNTGVWIRRNWPQLFYIASVHHFNRYALAAWSGISGEAHYFFPCEADEAVVSSQWIESNIQSVSALGAKYPDPEFIVEGDTPSLLYMIPNGLSDPQYPEWGSWGGRYGPVNYGEGHFADTVDVVVDQSGKTIMGSHITVWRWREAFQTDFAARMQWSAQPKFTKAQHAPVVSVNGDTTRNVLKIIAKEGQEIIVDASSSCDPDGGKLSYKWWQYLEPSSTQNSAKDVSTLALKNTDSAKVTATIPTKDVLRAEGRNKHPRDDKHLHLILEVSNGKLISYRRVVFTILGPDSLTLLGGQEETHHDEL